jgi:hypothetical protein
MAWAAVIAGGASLVGGLVASQGAQSAAGTQASSADAASQAQLQAANNSIAAQQQAGEAAQANQQPWINAGSSALTQLGNLLGVPIAASGQYSAPTTQSAGGNTSAGGSNGTSNSLVSMVNGIPQPNQQLYQSNPQYKSVWDSVSQANQSRFGTGYRTDSDPTMLQKELTDGLKSIGIDPASLNANPQGSFQPNTVYGGPTGGFSGATGNGGTPGSPGANATQGLRNVAGWTGADRTSMGSQSRQRVSDLMGFNGADPTAALAKTPGYKFSLQQGLQGVENSASARGMQLSGATMKDLNNYAQGTAQQTYQQQLGDAQSIYNDQFSQANTLYNNQVGDLMSMAGLGSGAAGTASSNTVSTGSNIGNTITGAGSQIGSNMIGAGNARAAGQVGSANAIGGAMGSIGQIYTMNQLFGNGGGNGATFGPNTFTMPNG